MLGLMNELLKRIETEADDSLPERYYEVEMNHLADRVAELLFRLLGSDGQPGNEEVRAYLMNSERFADYLRPIAK
jgi:hypothetical protein